MVAVLRRATEAHVLFECDSELGYRRQRRRAERLVVCSTWLLENNYFYLLDLTRGRFEYPQLRDTALALARRFEPQTILIEDASTGISLAQELRTGPRYYGVQAIPIHHDKIGRLFVQQGKFAAGLVLFPRSAAFLPVLEAELLTFPQGKHDDQVDSISQALGHEGLSYNIRALL
jgi:predicted phage terminase large subunit-like protein